MLPSPRLEGRIQRQDGSERGDAGTDVAVQRLADACNNIETGTTRASDPHDGRLYNAWANMELRSRRFSAARKILKKGREMYPRDHSVSDKTIGLKVVFVNRSMFTSEFYVPLFSRTRLMVFFNRTIYSYVTLLEKWRKELETSPELATCTGESLRIQPSAPTLVSFAMLELRLPHTAAPLDFDKVRGFV